MREPSGINTLKIHIIFDFKEGPYGGGNQFLKALKVEFQNAGVYTENPHDADVCLFNGHPFADFDLVTRLHETRLDYPEKAYIFRLDGPTFKVRGTDKYCDLLLKGICDLYMDGIVFQSQWCRRSNRELTGISSRHEEVILNAPDRAIFNVAGKCAFTMTRKTRLIATSWSSNVKKGFDVYRYLDDHLDWSRYEMTFVGNSPFSFRNIRWLQPQTSVELSKTIKQHDIFITASQSDPCSNALIEALSCGLPAVALNDGGHPEVIGDGGVFFEKMEEIPERIETLIRDYDAFQDKIPIFDIAATAGNYLEFGRAILKSGIERKGLNAREVSSLNGGYGRLRRIFRRNDFISRVKRKLYRYAR